MSTRKYRFMMKTSAICCAIVVVMLYSNRGAHAFFNQPRCTDAVEDYQGKLTALMALNKTYTQTLADAAKALKKSAKRYRAGAERIRNSAADRHISRREAAKLVKMNLKTQKIRQEAQTVLQATRRIEDLGDETYQAWVETQSGCSDN